MTVKIGGYSANTIMEVEANTLAARAVARPFDWSPSIPFFGGGSYSRKTVTGAIVQPASGILFELRWTNPNLLCAIRRLKMSLLKPSGSSSANVLATWIIQAFVARLFTASGSGGTAYVANDSGKRRGIQPPTTFSDLRINSTTQAGIATGTWTLDTDPFAAVVTSASNTFIDCVPEFGMDGIRAAKPFLLWEALPGEYPLMLSPNEGIDITHATTGGISIFTFVQAMLTVEYDEVPNT